MLDNVISAIRPHNFRGKLRLLDGLVPHTGERVASVFGYRIRLDLGEAIQRWIYMGAFEPKETALASRWLRPGMTFLDVGANVGYFTLLAASRVGRTGRVDAIEPSPYAFNRLSRTVQENGIEQVRLIRAGLSDESGEVTLYVQPVAAGFHSPTMSVDSSLEPVQVPVLRLDDLLDKEGIDHVDLMKLDVEGHELHVLRGGSGALSSGRVRAILCEFNEHWLHRQGGSSSELYAALRDAGFEDEPPAKNTGPGAFETRFMVHRSSSRHHNG